MTFMVVLMLFYFKQKTAYEVRISDWSSDVCSSDLCTGISPQTSSAVCDAMMKLILPVTCIVVLRKHGPRCITLSRAKKERRRYFTCAAASDRHQLMCLLTSLVISNMLTLDLPPKTFFSCSSSLILLRFFWSCSLCFLLYVQWFLLFCPPGLA